jgi:hypothetical protein
MSAESRLAHARKTRDLIRQVKSAPCMDCGETYPWYVMDFDHVRGEKSFNIGAAHSRGIRRIRLEIDKCDVVCANCHRLRTHARLTQG